MYLLDCDSSPIQSPLHPSRSNNMLNLLHTSAAYRRTYPFHAEEKVLMLHGIEFRSCLGMGMNTLSSVYKPLHKYRSLRVSNFPHLYELCTTLTVIEQHIPFYIVSSLTKCSALP
ncbi:hypothetical protein GW17_00060561 [Ensete ventricosum]|nr:hypothetical protein GW17_00060561 [Ensete ventricosum]RZR75953.1 hypothetical protein BHM03_00000538 [Ensete ventricosum]